MEEVSTSTFFRNTMRILVNGKPYKSCSSIAGQALISLAEEDYKLDRATSERWTAAESLELKTMFMKNKGVSDDHFSLKGMYISNASAK